MPTQDEFNELLSGTTHEWVTNHNGSGVNGYKFTSSNGNSIFIPAAGYYSEGSVNSIGYGGRVWSSSLDTSDPNGAWYLYFSSGSCYMTYRDRYVGWSVRGVRK